MHLRQRLHQDRIQYDAFGSNRRLLSLEEKETLNKRIEPRIAAIQEALDTHYKPRDHVHEKTDKTMRIPLISNNLQRKLTNRRGRGGMERRMNRRY